MVGSSFLKTGVILANFHLAGTTPRERDILKRLQSEGAISSATLDRTLLGIPSGPHALLGSKLRSTAATSGIVRSISERLLREDSDEVESVEGGSTLIGPKTPSCHVLNGFKP